MSVTPNNLVVYGAANMPEADGVTIGGAVDFTKRVAFYDITPAGTVDWVSSSASDTAVKAQITGRDPSGAIQTSAVVTLSGQTVVTGSQSLERLGAAVITGGAIAGLANPGGTAAVGDVAAMGGFDGVAILGGHTARQVGHGLGTLLLRQLAPHIGVLFELLDIDVATARRRAGKSAVTRRVGRAVAAGEVRV